MNYPKPTFIDDTKMALHKMRNLIDDSKMVRNTGSFHPMEKEYLGEPRMASIEYIRLMTDYSCKVVLRDLDKMQNSEDLLLDSAKDPAAIAKQIVEVSRLISELSGCNTERRGPFFGIYTEPETYISEHVGDITAQVCSEMGHPVLNGHEKSILPTVKEMLKKGDSPSKIVHYMALKRSTFASEQNPGLRRLRHGSSYNAQDAVSRRNFYQVVTFVESYLIRTLIDEIKQLKFAQKKKNTAKRGEKIEELERDFKHAIDQCNISDMSPEDMFAILTHASYAEYPTQDKYYAEFSRKMCGRIKGQLRAKEGFVGNIISVTVQFEGKGRFCINVVLDHSAKEAMQKRGIPNYSIWHGRDGVARVSFKLRMLDDLEKALSL